MNNIIRCIGFIILGMLPYFIHATEIQGKVIKIIDGDTFDIVLSNHEVVRIRMLHIDAPEKKQDFGNASKQALAKNIFGKQIRVVYEHKDRNGRVLGEVFVGEQNINLWMVTEGWAWHFIRYSKNKKYAAAQQTAKIYKKGLWKQTQAIPPWVFRHQKH